jgi:hypothetical protein
MSRGALRDPETVFLDLVAKCKKVEELAAFADKLAKYGDFSTGVAGRR